MSPPPRPEAGAGAGPFFFGDGDRQLFGFFHPPDGGSASDRAALLSAPIGQEYIRTHRAFRQLAVRLARSGIPSLRFDYSGCGDSHGDLATARLSRWTDDLGRARDELAARAPGREIVLVGLGIGGALAMLLDAAFDRVLWDPVVRGHEYLETMRREHENMARYSAAKWKDGEPNEGSAEYLGFRLPASLVDDIEALDLLDASPPAAGDVLLIDSGVSAGLAELSRILESSGVRVETRNHPMPDDLDDDPFKPRVPNDVLRSIVNWLGRDR